MLALGTPSIRRSAPVRHARWRAGLLALSLVILSGSGGPIYGQGSPVRAFRLTEEWSFSPPPPRQLSQVIDVAASPWTRELYVVDGARGEVYALAPSGSVLRVIGAGIVQRPSDVAVVLPRLSAAQGSGRLPLASRDVRLFVAEAERSLLHVFDLQGRALRTDIPMPTVAGSLVGLNSDHALARAVLLDQPGSLVYLDASGDIQDRRRLADGSGSLGKASRVAATKSWQPANSVGVTVLDEDSGTIAWTRLDGTIRHQADVTAVLNSGRPTVLALAGFGSNHLAYLATDRGLWVVDAEPIGSFVALRPLDVPGLGGHIVALDTFGAGDPNVLPRKRKGQIFAATDAGSRLLHLYDNGQASNTAEESPITSACPQSGTMPAESHRILRGDHGTLYVSLVNGMVLGVEQGTVVDSFEIGSHDDLAFTPQGDLLASSEGSPIAFERSESGLTTIGIQTSATGFMWWLPFFDCIPAGNGLGMSIGASRSDPTWLMTTRPEGLTPDANATYDAAQHQIARLVPSGDLAWENPLRSESRLWRGSSFPPRIEWITDLAVSPDGQSAAAVERLQGRVHRFTQAEGVHDSTSLSLPGRPHRVTWSDSNRLYVLDAQGFVFELDPDGKVTSSWDAGGAVGGSRPEFTDITVLGEDRVHLLDRRNRVYVFEPDPSGGELAPPIALPPPCSITTGHWASAPRVQLGQVITATVSLAGACQRRSRASDILVLQDPQLQGTWQASVFQDALSAFVGELGESEDRVGLMVFDTTAELIHALTSRHEEVVAKVPEVFARRADYEGSRQPLLEAKALLDAEGRPDANHVVLLFWTGAMDRGWSMNGLVAAAEALRRAGVRVIVVTDSIRYSRVPLLLADQPEDLYIAPDPAALTELYHQLGLALRARFLLRTAEIVLSVPENFDYEPDSAAPKADWDALARTLTWEPRQVDFGGWLGSYRLRPRLLGPRAISDAAVIRFVDGLGIDGSAQLPIPWVDVFAPPTPTASPSATPTNTPPPPSPTRSMAYLPVVISESCEPKTQRRDLVIAVDASSSMLEEDGENGSKLESVRAAIETLLGSIDFGEGHQVALYAFHHEAELLAPLGSSVEELLAGLDGIRVDSGTRLDLALSAAASELWGPRHSEGSSRALVLLTDGHPDAGTRVEAEAITSALRSDGLSIFTIGVGAGHDSELLRAIATRSEWYYPVTRASLVEEVLAEVFVRIPCPSERFWARR